MPQLERYFPVHTLDILRREAKAETVLTPRKRGRKSKNPSVVHASGAQIPC
jgi:hypothetical protein